MNELPIIPKVSITDPELMTELQPADISRYLEARGWERIDGGRNEHRAYRSGRDIYAYVPAPDAGDQDRAMLTAGAIRSIARSEERSEMEVYWDVCETAEGPARARSVLPLPRTEAHRLLPALRELLRRVGRCSAACRKCARYDPVRELAALIEDAAEGGRTS